MERAVMMYGYLTAKERCQMLGNLMCWNCHKHLKGPAPDDAPPDSESNCALCRKRNDSSFRSPVRIFVL